MNQGEGEFVWSVGTMGYSEGGEFMAPRGIALGEDGHLYICDTYTYRIQEFDTDGTFESDVTDGHFVMPAHMGFNPVNDSRFVANDGERTHIFRDDWYYRFYFYGSTAFQQWVDFAYAERDTGTFHIVEFAVTEEVLYPEDFDHYIEFEEEEYRFATHDLTYWSFGSQLIHPEVQQDILDAISSDMLILELRIVASIPDPASPELMALNGSLLPAYDWLYGDFLGNVMVRVNVETP